MATAVFDYNAWVARYPEFRAVPFQQAEAFYVEAALYHDNTTSSPVSDAGQQALLMHMMTAHIAALNGYSDNSGLVGRVSQASEGSVSVSADWIDAKTQREAWCNQTRYGAAYWAATGRFRRFAYVPGC